MASRGWNPPNYYLLDSSELRKHDNQQELRLQETETITRDPESINTSTGKAADVMDTLIQHQMVDGGIEERNCWLCNKSE